MNSWKVVAALAGVLALAACSQKDPAADAIAAAENALNAVYEDAQKYVPERYAEVKAELESRAHRIQRRALCGCHHRGQGPARPRRSSSRRKRPWRRRSASPR